MLFRLALRQATAIEITHIYLPIPPFREAFWTFCSPKRMFSGVATLSGRLRSCSAKSPLADDYVPGWVALMDFVPVARYLIRERPNFLFPVSLRTLGSGLIGFQTPSARSCDSDSTSDHCASLPVQGNPRRDTRSAGQELSVGGYYSCLPLFCPALLRGRTFPASLGRPASLAHKQFRLW